MNEEPLREAVALFHDEAAFESALAALGRAGFAPDRVSLLASCEAVEAKLGQRFRKVAELEDAAATPRVAYVPAEEKGQSQSSLIGALSFVAASFGLILASSGGLAPMILAATAAGSAVASVAEALKWLVGHEHARAYEEELKCGGLLLWVRVEDELDAKLAAETLKQHGAADVHLHTVVPPPALAS
jgi:hypothetical protein